MSGQSATLTKKEGTPTITTVDAEMVLHGIVHIVVVLAELFINLLLVCPTFLPACQQN